jgi:hypothetical protein
MFVIVVAAIVAALAVIDPEAMTLLERASATLAQAHTIVVWARLEREEVGSSGQIFNSYTDMEAMIMRPDGLFMATVGDRLSYATWYYSGVLTVYLPMAKTYGKVELGMSDDALIAALYGQLHFPSTLAEFLESNPYSRFLDEVKTARVIGTVRAGDALCKQLAFTGNETDWQLWVTIDDANPLPARIAVISKKQPGMPRAVIEFMKWDLNGPLSPSVFKFKPPAGARAVSIQWQ